MQIGSPNAIAATVMAIPSSTALDAANQQQGLVTASATAANSAPPAAAPISTGAGMLAANAMQALINAQAQASATATSNPPALAGTTSSPPSSAPASQTLQAAQQTDGSSSNEVSFPPPNAPQSVVDAWNKATAGLSGPQKTMAGAMAMFADGQLQVSLSPDGQIQTGGSNFVSANFNWQGLSQSVIGGLQRDQQYSTTATEQADVQSMIDAFQNFQTNLG